MTGISSNPLNKTLAIESFSPSSLAAGVGDILTIEGEDFGLLTGTLEFLPTCPNPFGTVWVRLDNYDMSSNGGLVSWSNTKIEVRVPSMVYGRVGTDINTNNDIYGALDLCTARFRVIPSAFGGPNDPSPLSNTALEVSYSVEQFLSFSDQFSPALDDKLPIQIGPDGNDDEINFQIDSRLLDNCIFLEALQESLQEWSCETGINWKVDEIDEGTIFAPEDNKSSIYLFDFTFGGFFEDNTIALADYTNELCNIENVGQKQEFDIQVSENIENFSLDDIKQTILHELGHHQGLRHTLPLSQDTGDRDLMYPDLTGSATINSNDLAGALFVKEESEFQVCGTEIDYEQFGDYGMRNNLADSGKEPDCNSLITAGNGTPDIFKSPDVFNCQEPGNNSCNFVNQQPLEGNVNYIHARITNFSTECSASGGRVEFYWTIGSTGEVWREDWINDMENGCLIGDMIGFRDLGFFEPEETRVVSLDWVPPIINQLVDCDIYRYPWDVEQDRWQICLLARIVSDYDGIYLEQEDVSIGDNVINSNNLATINTVLLDDPDLVVPGNDTCYLGKPTNIIFSNNNATSQNLDLVFKVDPEYVGTGSLENVEVILPPELAAQVDDSYTTFDNLDAIRLQGDMFYITDIQMAAREKHAIGIRILVCSSDGIEPRSAPNLFSFSISHKSSNGSNINSSSSSHFYLYDNYHNIVNLLTGSSCDNTSTLADFDIYSVDGRFIRTVSNLNRQDFDQQIHRISLKTGVYIIIKTVNGRFCETFKAFTI